MVALGGIILRECPETAISQFSRNMIDLFWMCFTAMPAQGGPVLIPAGPPPSPGGMLDQDNATMEAFGVIRGEIREMAPKPKKKTV